MIGKSVARIGPSRFLPGLLTAKIAHFGRKLSNLPDLRGTRWGACPSLILPHKGLRVPELPEVETMVRGIRPHVEGRRIDAMTLCRCRCKRIQFQPAFRTLSRQVRGQTVDHIYRLGKRVVLELSSQRSLVIEPHMTGLMLLNEPPDREHLRVMWQLAGKARYHALWFWDRRGLGTISLHAPDDFHRLPTLARLGPDALTMTEDQWAARFRATSRSIKVALLDQRLVAGIGNLYASEILHAARLHPAHRADVLKPAEIHRLYRAAKRVLEEAIRCEGSTLSDATYRNALARAGQYQNKHRVYDRAGRKCPRCRDSVVVRIVQAQRSTYYCPGCQPEANLAARD